MDSRDRWVPQDDVSFLGVLTEEEECLALKRDRLDLLCVLKHVQSHDWDRAPVLLRLNDEKHPLLEINVVFYVAAHLLEQAA